MLPSAQKLCVLGWNFRKSCDKIFSLCAIATCHFAARSRPVLQIFACLAAYCGASNISVRIQEGKWRNHFTPWWYRGGKYSTSRVEKCLDSPTLHAIQLLFVANFVCYYVCNLIAQTIHKTRNKRWQNGRPQWTKDEGPGRELNPGPPPIKQRPKKESYY